jgi:hypothetical protein
LGNQERRAEGVHPDYAQARLTFQRPLTFVFAGVSVGWAFVLFDVLRRHDA